MVDKSMLFLPLFIIYYIYDIYFNKFYTGAFKDLFQVIISNTYNMRYINNIKMIDLLLSLIPIYLYVIFIYKSPIDNNLINAYYELTKILIVFILFLTENRNMINNKFITEQLYYILLLSYLIITVILIVRYNSYNDKKNKKNIFSIK